jgi:drug/metabolite transporter (DMT)-like permease
MQRTALQRLILACFMWGLSFPTVKALSLVQQAAAPDQSSWLYSTVGLVLRFSLAAAVVLGGLAWSRGKLRFQRLEIEQGLLVALSSGLGMLFQMDGLAHTSASTSAFLTQGSIIFVPLARWALQKQRPTSIECLCISVALAGVAILSGFSLQGWALGRGELETLVSALFFTAHIMIVSAERYRDNDSLSMSAIMFSGIAVIFAPVVAFMPGGWSAGLQSVTAPSAWLFIAILIGPCTLMAFLWMNRWQRYVSASAAALIYCLEPVYANEQFTPQLLLGGALILVANLGCAKWGR